MIQDFSSSLKLLRKVDNLSPGARAYLQEEYERRRQSIDPLTDKLRADVVNPATGWVDNDLPRDEAITLELIEQHKAFAVSDPFGRIVRQFKTLEDAEKARNSATVKFNVDVEVDGIEAEEEEGTGELAGTARRARGKGGLD